MPPPPAPSRPATGLTAALLSASSAFSCPPNLLFFAAAAALSVLYILKPTAASPPSTLSRRRLLSSASVAMRRAAPSAPPLAFSSPESLSDWLRPRLPSGAFASWGVAPGTKSVQNLWLELSQGETSLLLQEDEIRDEKGGAFTPLRAVHVATVRIRNARGAVLVESRQLLSDGTERPRCRPLAEKMKPGETVEEAVLRAVREELGKEEVNIVPGSYQMRVEERDSASYPGLMAQYILHSVDAEVEGLPEEEFSTEENGEEVEAMEKAVFVKRHYWKWIEDAGDVSLQQPR